MNWVKHLNELKYRLLLTISFACVMFLMAFGYANEIYMLMSQPLVELFPSSSQLIATSVVTPIVTPIKLSLYIAMLLSMPFACYQAWTFLLPALYPNEKKATIWFMVASLSLFYIGLVFAYYIVLPMILLVATHYGPESIILLPDMYLLLNFVLQLLLVFGLMFQTPVIIVLLHLSGIMTYHTLQEHRRMTIVLSLVVSMLITPPDVISQVMLALPIIMLIELGIAASRCLESTKSDLSLEKQFN